MVWNSGFCNLVMGCGWLDDLHYMKKSTGFGGSNENILEANAQHIDRLLVHGQRHQLGGPGRSLFASLGWSHGQRMNPIQP